MKFNINDIAGIELASIEEIEKVEKQALKEIERIKSLTEKQLNNHIVDMFKWYEKVAFECNYRLKQLGYRELSDWEKLL